MDAVSDRAESTGRPTNTVQQNFVQQNYTTSRNDAGGCDALSSILSNTASSQGTHDYELKRQYLSLLPPKQIIELCLTFDAYVPPYAKTTIWPSDLSAAIVNLQNVASSSSTDKTSLPKDGSEASQAQESCITQSENTKSAEPPPLGPSSSDPAAPEIARKSPSEPASDQQPRNSEPLPVQATSSPATDTPAEQSPQNAQAAPSQPYHSYGYGQPHQYPHTPYYPSAYPYSYSYPPSSGFQSPASGTTPYVPHPTPYGSLPVPLQPESSSAMDDLPSYEEMIVEALSECGDPEGSMPKDLFTWMAARYPLQSNFRPSASQALQKAYKRGRFEKASNGKYRLSATWEGGSTSRRTTRRPQTQSHAASGSTNRPPLPPFTHAPLGHHRNISHPSSQPPYPPHPYGYPGYPAYGSQISPVGPSSSLATGPGPAQSATKSAPAETESAAAYEAAQSILKAINFGSLLELSPKENEQKTEAPMPQPSQPVGNGIEHLLSHVQAVLASRTSEQANTSSNTLPALGSTFSSPISASSRGAASTDARAELQAQLALLSAQLVELAQSEDSSATESQQATIASSHQPLMHSLIAEAPVSSPPQAPYRSPDDPPSISLSSNVPTLHPSENNSDLAPPLQDSGSSDEDDMEEVI